MHNGDGCTAFAKFDSDDSLLIPKTKYGNSHLSKSAIKWNCSIYEYVHKQIGV